MFLVNVPVVIVALILGRLIVPDSKDPSPSALDPVGAVLSIVGLVSLIYAIIEAPSHGWTSTQTLATFAFALIVLAVFAIWELRSDHPMLDVTFFENPRFTAANISIVLVFFALFGSLFFLTQYLQFVLGYTPLQAGLRVAPIALVLMVSAPLAGRFVTRFGNKALVASGMTAVAIGLGFLGTITVSSGYPRVLIALVILGLGMGTAMVPATESIMGSLPLAKAGLGSAMNDTTRQIGGALGVAILGSVFASSYTANISSAVSGLPAETRPTPRRVPSGRAGDRRTDGRCHRRRDRHGGEGVLHLCDGPGPVRRRDDRPARRDGRPHLAAEPRGDAARGAAARGARRTAIAVAMEAAE